jgi:hypothetical protein
MIATLGISAINSIGPILAAASTGIGAENVSSFAAGISTSGKIRGHIGITLNATKSIFVVDRTLHYSGQCR